MKFLISIIFALFLFIQFINANQVYVWMCLERCNQTQQQVEKNLEQIGDLRNILSGISFEKYNLGNDSNFVDNIGLTNVSKQLNEWGLITLPMISSYPYPPQFIVWMRNVFKNPLPFINEAINLANQFDYKGFNVDWEPTVNGTEQDSKDYANFLDQFAKALHQHGKVLSVDVANWNPLWNFTLLSQTNIDLIMTMSTYTGNFEYFEENLVNAVSQIGLDKLVVGLETVDTTNNLPYSTANIAKRFDLINKYNVNKIAFWKSPIYANFVPFITKFIKQ
eukprot:TRINITY_DN10352_c0_g1_i1.p1 TRINITY_DN10352_c0_g1~~TRINITY_DN10352_c0_g1_i1.p1  ORF type:complete len:278 (+),score=56.74 TRINITY_DN10352_c0_g1_i1:1-834(+)